MFLIVPWALLVLIASIGSPLLAIALLVSRLRDGGFYERWGYLLGAAIVMTVAMAAMDAFFVQQFTRTGG